MIIDLNIILGEIKINFKNSSNFEMKVFETNEKKIY